MFTEELELMTLISQCIPEWKVGNFNVDRAGLCVPGRHLVYHSYYYSSITQLWCYLLVLIPNFWRLRNDYFHPGIISRTLKQWNSEPQHSSSIPRFHTYWRILRHSSPCEAFDSWARREAVWMPKHLHSCWQAIIVHW